MLRQSGANARGVGSTNYGMGPSISSGQTDTIRFGKDSFFVHHLNCVPVSLRGCFGVEQLDQKIDSLRST